MFTKIEIPSSWKEEYTKYPNGKTIWEALSAAMTSFNDFVDEVNVDVQEGLLSIDQAEDTLRSELSAAFDSMSEDFQMDFSALQDEVDAAVASVADKVTQAQLDAVNAQLAEMTQDLIIPPEKTNFVTKEYETFDTQAIPFSNSGQKISYLTGVMSADVNKSSTDKIDLANMTHLYRYYGDGSTTTKFSDSIVAFYDASQVFISGLNRRTAYDLTLFEGKNVIIYPIPTGAKYVAFTVDMVNVANFNHAIRRGVDSAIIIDGVRLKDINDIDGKLLTKLDKSDVVPTIFKKEYIEDSHPWIPDTYILPSDGRVFSGASYADYRATDFIDLSDVTKLFRFIADGTSQTMQPDYIHAFYDEDHIYISGAYRETAYTLEYFDGNYGCSWIIPVNAKYVRFCAKNVAFNTASGFYYHYIMYKSIEGTSVDNLVLSGDKMAGKKIVNFGDSIFGKSRGFGSVSHYIEEVTKATAYNVGFGGCQLTVHSSPLYNAFSMYKLADAVTEGDYTDQDTAMLTINMPYFGENLAILKTIDFSDVDYVTIGYGTNDFTANALLDNAGNPLDFTTIKGSLRYSIEKLLTAFPKLKIVLVAPAWRFYVDGSNVYTDDSDTRLNGQGKLLGDVVKAYQEVANEYHLPCIDTYYDLGINKINRLEYFYGFDGTHQNRNGRKLLGEKIGKFLLNT